MLARQIVETLRKHWPLTTLIVTALVACVALFLTHHYNYRDVRASEEWVSYTQNNISDALEFSTALQKAIVAHGTYLNLGNEAQHARAVTAFDALPGKLQPLLSNIHEPESQNALAEIRYEVDALRHMGEQTMTARAQGHLAKAYNPAANEAFFKLADHIEANLDRVRNREHDLLVERLLTARHEQSHYVLLMLVGSISALLIVIVGCVLMIRLQTRKELIEGQLKDARERLDLAFKGASDGVWDWNPVSGEIYLSPRLKEILGFRDHELENSIAVFDALGHPEDRAENQALTRRYLAREIPRYETVFRMRHKDGSWRWIMSRGIALWDANGTPCRMVGVHTDITSLKQMEEDLRAAKAAADTASRTKSSFLANMSHEIRTPMNAIIGISGILARSGKRSGKEREYIEALDIASKSLFALINDLLDLSKLDEGSLTVERIPFDIRTVINEAVTLASMRAEEKGIALSAHIDPSLPKSFVGDPLRLRQILGNLLSNAVKFTDAGSVMLLADLTPVGHLELRVRDTGIGIPRDKLPRIFDRFTQSDHTISRRFGGTGLGLAISRELAELMGGSLDVASEEGKGSEFSVTLPFPAARAEAPRAAARAAAPEAAAAIRGCVLVVEDYKPNILVVRTILQSIGYDCQAVGSGAEALTALCTEKRPAYVAVLMDVQLPDVSGVEVTTRVRAHEQAHGFAPVPIIAVTAHALLGDREKFLQAGMDAYIAKPFDPDDLAEKLAGLTADANAPKDSPAPKKASA